jgi:NodT family efflux transporter outer membrane factor (OMF) lipoprotein
MQLRSILCSAGVLLLAACAAGPDYRRPEVPTPDRWQAKQQDHLVDVRGWWRQFKDPVLDGLLEAAQQDSPSLAKATAAIDKARAARGSSAAALWPSLTGNASAARSGSLRRSTGVAETDLATLDASWEVDLFGKHRRSVESSEALLEGSRADWQGARVSLMAEVASDYVDYRACRLKQQYYEAQAASQASTLSLTTLSGKAGFTALADVRLAEASAANTQATALAQKVECEVQVKSLVALTGLDETDLRARLGEAVAALPEPAGLEVAAVPADLLRQRPDLVSAERSLASASALIGVAEAQRFPSLSLSGSIGASRTRGLSVGTPWSFGPALSLPIFDGGAIDASVKSAKADYDSALASYRQTVRDAVKEVEQALTRLDSMAEREDAARRSAEGYANYLDATERHRRAGGASQLDLETARRNAIGAQISLLELRQARLDYWIALYKAVGGGWQADEGNRS